MNRLILLLATIISISTCSIAQLHQKNVLLIKNVTVIDMKDGKLFEAMDIFISNDRITEIKKNIKVSTGTKVIDGSGKFLIPGLWDMHVHLFNNSSRTGTDNHELYFPLF